MFLALRGQETMVLAVCAHKKRSAGKQYFCNNVISFAGALKNWILPETKGDKINKKHRFPERNLSRNLVSYAAGCAWFILSIFFFDVYGWFSFLFWGFFSGYPVFLYLQKPTFLLCRKVPEGSRASIVQPRNKMCGIHKMHIVSTGSATSRFEQVVT